MTTTTHPPDTLVRARYDPGTCELRAASDGSEGRTLHGHFAVFDQWTRIDSWFEGTFLERLAPGAFTRTFKDKAGQIRILYDHGRDPSIGNKPLGAPDVMREDDEGAYYESDLFDADYVNQLIPALRKQQLGASFRFSIAKDGDEWVQPKRATDHNPDKIRERTITDVDLYEFGPVTFPAYTGASAGVRATDDFIDLLRSDPLCLARFAKRAPLDVVERLLLSVGPVAGRSTPAETEAAAGGSEKATRTSALLAVERARMALLT